MFFEYLSQGFYKLGIKQNVRKKWKYFIVEDIGPFNRAINEKKFSMGKYFYVLPDSKLCLIIEQFTSTFFLINFT